MSSQEIRGNLARLLATENLIVEHRRVATASFDVDRRILTLPNWDRASKVVYDMLVAHECGHALFTPNEDWTSMFDCPKDFVNVIEDARIEKLMKQKYPGLRKSFAGGYKELNDQVFFGIADEDLNTFSLIDRINLHSKIGAGAMIPFSIEEKVFVARINVAETFDEVCQIAVDVYEFSKKEQEQEQTPEAEMPANQSSEGKEGEMTHEEMLEEAQRREENNSSSTSQSQPHVGEDYNDEEEIEGSKTQDSFNDAAKKLTDRFGDNSKYVEIPSSVNLSDYIADWTEVHDWIDEQRDVFVNDPDATDNRYDRYIEVDTAFDTFRKQSQKEVNYLVKEFECRKSADAYARASQSKTGVLDTSKLHTYRYNEDLFKKVTVVPDGKNHGLIFILDWSGSMQNVLLATVKQLLNLTAFCKKVQIPFEVYAFTNEWQIAQRAIDNNTEIDYYGGWYGNHYREWKGIERGKIFLAEGEFHMVNFISSRSNPKDYERQCKNFFRQAYAFGHRTLYGIAPGLNLSGTPLNEAVVMLNYIIPKFKRDNDLQKVNACILTDGESNSASYGTLVERTDREDYVSPRSLDSYGTCVLRDRKTGIVYGNLDGYAKTTTTFIQQVRDRNEGVNVVGFRILPAKRLSEFVARFADYSHYEEVQKQWRKQKSAILPFPKGYSALYAISSKDLEDDSEFEVEESATKAQITRAFKKMLKSKSTNKKLLTSFVDQIA